MDKFHPPRDAIPHRMTLLWTLFAGERHRPSIWVYSIRLEALPLIVWGQFMYLLRQWYCGGDVVENVESLDLLVNVLK